MSYTRHCTDIHAEYWNWNWKTETETDTENMCPIKDYIFIWCPIFFWPVSYKNLPVQWDDRSFMNETNLWKLHNIDFDWFKPKFYYANFATKSRTSSRQSHGLVADTNHENPQHKSRRQLSWFVSQIFVICVRDFHRNFVVSWFVTVCVRNFHDLCPQLSPWGSFSESWCNGIWALTSKIVFLQVSDLSIKKLQVLWFLCRWRNTWRRRSLSIGKKSEASSALRTLWVVL